MCDKFIIKKDNNYKKKSRTVPQFSNIPTGRTGKYNSSRKGGKSFKTSSNLRL